MESIPEVLITSSKVCCAFDTDTGNVIAQYKETHFAPKTLTLIGEDYLIGAIANQPKLRVWTLSQIKKEAGTFTCCGNVTALAASGCGTYCVGAIGKELHVWKVSSGELLNVISRHYGDITCLRFSSDDSHIFSGGKDGLVLVWILSQVIGVHIERGQVKPRFVWSGHTSDITDIHTGSLGAVSNIATTSLDMTCRIYELGSGILLTTICMDVPLTAVVLDPLEYYVFLGALDGSIYKINIYEKLPKEIHSSENQEDKVHVKAHKQKVISLSLSFDGTKLISASEDQTCRFWNIICMSFLSEISHEGNLTNAFLAVRPTAFCHERILPCFPISPFQREFDNGSIKLLESKMQCNPLTVMTIKSTDEIYSPNIISACMAVKDDVNSLESQKYDSMFQASLHGGMVNEMKAVNNQMYSFVIEHALDNLEDMD